MAPKSKSHTSRAPEMAASYTSSRVRARLSFADARSEGRLDHVQCLGRQLLDLQLLTRLVQPQQGAGLQLHRSAQQIQRVEQLLVDGLDGSLRQLLLFLGARADAAGPREGRGD